MEVTLGVVTPPLAAPITATNRLFAGGEKLLDDQAVLAVLTNFIAGVELSTAIAWALGCDQRRNEDVTSNPAISKAVSLIFLFLIFSITAYILAKIAFLTKATARN
jgi:uncharacterized PurR-regulated membrane protein YhhQ (DUF165 family)